MSKKVSVIIPVYNTEKWVEQSITSVFNGGYENLEVIVVDDGSPDNSRVIIDKMITEYGRIIYIRKKNGGLPAARESGINVATGDYILFVDSDDFIKEGSIGEMVECAEKSGADMVYTDYMIFHHSDPNAILDMNPNNIAITDGISYLSHRFPCYICMKLFRSELLVNIKQQKSSVCEDLFAMVQILPRCKKIEYIKRPLYYYRQTEHSIMRASRERTVGEWMSHSLQMIELLPTLSLPQNIIDIFFYEHIHTIHRFIKEGNREDPKYKLLLRELITKNFSKLRYKSINSSHRIKLVTYLFTVRIIRNLL